MPPGKDTTTTLRQASARLVEIGEVGEVGDGGGAAATRIDLLGDRFLRRQVRVLVATAVAAAAESAESAAAAAAAFRRIALFAPPALLASMPPTRFL